MWTKLSEQTLARIETKYFYVKRNSETEVVETNSKLH